LVIIGTIIDCREYGDLAVLEALKEVNSTKPVLEYGNFFLTNKTKAWHPYKNKKLLLGRVFWA